jgi:rhodanese-related sulfurtransferase
MLMGSEKLEDRELEPGRARELVASEGGQVLDVRGDEEFLADRIAGAVRAESEDIDAALEALDQDQPVLVVCEDGKRSAEIADDLRERGYQAAAIKGGMKAWTGAKMPTLPREAEEFHGPRRPGPLGS